jgi:cellulase/cellobiase CelA1
VNLSWAASTDNNAVAGYDIFRATGASGGTFASVGTATSPSFTNTGLVASTTYRYQVRARDAAGNVSGFSAAVTATTSASGGGGGGCAAAYRVTNAWQGAFQGEVVVTNTSTSASTSWTLTLVFPSGVTITQLWGGTFSPASGTVTVRNMSYNGALAPNASTTIGFIANASGSAGATATASCVKA